MYMCIQLSVYAHTCISIFHLVECLAQLCIYVPRNLGICAISRLRNAFMQSRDCATLVCNVGHEVLTSRKWHGSRVDKRPPVPLQSWVVYQLLWQPSFVCSFRLSCDRPRPLRLVSKWHYCSVALTSVSNKMAV